MTLESDGSTSSPEPSAALARCVYSILQLICTVNPAGIMRVAIIALLLVGVASATAMEAQAGAGEISKNRI